ncbi:unnamed protein product, partial [Discosporangium mesarthrocarpum]
TVATLEAARAAKAALTAEHMLEEAVQRLQEHEFSETFRSDKPDDLLISILHMLATATMDSMDRKRRAEARLSKRQNRPPSLAVAPPSTSHLPHAQHTTAEAGVEAGAGAGVGAEAGCSLAGSTARRPVAGEKRGNGSTSQGLIDFLFTECLFPSLPSNVPDRGKALGLTAASMLTPEASVAESSLGPKCKTRESRRAAFALLSSLCDGVPEHLQKVLVLMGGRDLVQEAFLHEEG